MSITLTGSARRSEFHLCYPGAKHPRRESCRLRVGRSRRGLRSVAGEPTAPNRISSQINKFFTFPINHFYTGSVVLRSIQVQRRGDRVDVWLAGGALDAQGARELVVLLGSLLEDAELRLLVLRSAGIDLCTGPTDDLIPELMQTDPTQLVAQLPVPVICLTTGQTRSVGLEIALACDFRIANLNATFALPDVISGRLPSWGGTQRITRVVDRATATAMLLLGQVLSSQEALRVGLVHEVAENPEDSLEKLAETLLSGAPLAQAYAKEAVRDGAEMPMRNGLWLEADLNILLQGSKDRAEGLSAFFGKRSPQFYGG